MVWEHELYNDMEYNAATEFLHTFEGEDYMVGFNFASLDEARDLKNVVEQKVLAKKRREGIKRVFRVVFVVSKGGFFCREKIAQFAKSRD